MMLIALIFELISRLRVKFSTNNMYNLLLALVVTSISLKYVSLEPSNVPVVQTKKGKIFGNFKEINGQVSEEFLGIKYAQVPSRFSASQVIKQSWDGEFYAQNFGPICMQINRTNMSEDCLSLNIWRPSNRNFSNILDARLPVLCYIHGSGYSVGFSGLHPGDILSAQKNIIVVSANYRLRSFGFAYGDEVEIPGNQALTDIISALLWIQENIADFGGDPNQVTLSGQSAGSMMSSIIPVIPSLPDNLFSRLLLMSGAALNTMFIESKETSLEKTKLLAAKIGCRPIDSGPLSSETIQCLKTIDAQILAQNDREEDIKALGGCEICSFMPVYGTSFLPNSLLNMLKSPTKIRNNNSFPIVFGIQQDEQGIFWPEIKPKNMHQSYNSTFAKVAFIRKNLTTQEFDEFFDYYFNGANNSDPIDLRNRTFELLNDFSWRCTSIILAQAYSAYHPVYIYEMRYIFEKYGRTQRPGGSFHEDSQEAIFGAPFRKSSTFSNRDQQFSDKMMTFVADYVKGIYDFSDWLKISFNQNEPDKDQIVKIFDEKNVNEQYKKQSICIKWSKLLAY